MTAAELIERLRALPPDTVVTVWDGPPVDDEAHIAEDIPVYEGRALLQAGELVTA